jgi:Arc/MetJ-type ribon-helix-helix transcriptional regulator
MSKAITVTPKRRGRPPTGRDPHLTMRLPQEMIDALEHWAAENHLSRSEAGRQLIALALKSRKAKPKAKR